MSSTIASHGQPESSVFGNLGKVIGTDEGDAYLKVRYDSRNIGWGDPITPTPIPTSTPTPTPTLFNYTPFSCNRIEVIGGYRCANNTANLSFKLDDYADIFIEIFSNRPSGAGDSITLGGNMAINQFILGSSTFSQTLSLAPGEYNLTYAREYYVLDQTTIRVTCTTGKNIRKVVLKSFCESNSNVCLNVYNISGYYIWHKKNTSFGEGYTRVPVSDEDLYLVLSAATYPSVVLGEVISAYENFSSAFSYFVQDCNPTPTPTSTPTPTPTPTPSKTPTPTPTPTKTSTPLPSSTPTNTPTATNPGPTSTIGPTSTGATPTPSASPIPASTATSTPPPPTPTPSATAQTYTVQANNGFGGYATCFNGDCSGNPITGVLAGSYIISASGDTGWIFNQWQWSGTNPGIVDPNSALTTINITSNATFTATYVQLCQKLWADYDSTGKVNMTYYPCGEDVPVTINESGQIPYRQVPTLNGVCQQIGKTTGTYASHLRAASDLDCGGSDPLKCELRVDAEPLEMGGGRYYLEFYYYPIVCSTGLRGTLTRFYADWDGYPGMITIYAHSLERVRGGIWSQLYIYDGVEVPGQIVHSPSCCNYN